MSKILNFFKIRLVHSSLGTAKVIGTQSTAAQLAIFHVSYQILNYYENH